MKLCLSVLITLTLISLLQVNAQQTRRDKSQFIEYKNETWDNIKKEIDEFEKKDVPVKKSFILDFSDIEIPSSIELFKPVWHNTPVMQSSTGTCWSFASTSFIESEVNRITKKEVKLSEMFTVYYEYLAKVTRFVKERGNSLVSEGSQTNATLRIMAEFGAVPVEIYTGMIEGQKHHAHEKMVKDINTYLDFCKKNSFWDEKSILENVKTILNHYMTEPPLNFEYKGVSYTPKTFMDNYLGFKPSNYVDIMSILEQGFWKQTIYDVPDNWWKSSLYYNVPMTEWINALQNAISNGYSVAISGDVSESGMYSYADAAVVPSYDIPSEFIDDNAKQFRFSNHTTTDDHGIHLIGKYKNKSGEWFLIKDSGSGARNGKHKGYYFFHSDFVKLKMTTFLVHKDAVVDLLKKFAK